jgi:hypothetical protein
MTKDAMQIQSIPKAIIDRECNGTRGGGSFGSVDGECGVEGGIASYDKLCIERSSGDWMDVMKDHIKLPILKTRQ